MVGASRAELMHPGGIQVVGAFRAELMVEVQIEEGKAQHGTIVQGSCFITQFISYMVALQPSFKPWHPINLSNTFGVILECRARS